MPRLLLVFLLFLFASVSYSAPEIVELQKLKAVKIEATRDSDNHRFKGELLSKQSMSWGFVIGNGNEILTNAHAIWNAQSIEVIANDGRRLRAQVVRLDTDFDAAVVRLNEKISAGSLFRANPLKPGDAVYAMDWQWFVKNGTVESVRHINSDFKKNDVTVQLISIDIEGRKGMSGGPLYDAHGRVAGFIARIDAYNNRLIAVPISEVLNFLK